MSQEYKYSQAMSYDSKCGRYWGKRLRKVDLPSDWGEDQRQDGESNSKMNSYANDRVAYPHVLVILESTTVELATIKQAPASLDNRDV